MAFYVYILECSDGSYYTGHTDNPEKEDGGTPARRNPRYTSRRLPVRLVFIEEFVSRQDAFERERQIKNWSRAKEALVRRDWDALQIKRTSIPAKRA